MPASAEETLSFLMKVLKHTEMPKPDWKAIAAEEGISRADNAQTKFRRMIKDIDFEYVKDQIVDPNGGAKGDGDNVATPTPTLTPRKRKSPTKKEKAAAGVESPSKKTKIDGSACGEADHVANRKTLGKKTQVKEPKATEAEAEAEVKGEIQD